MKQADLDIRIRELIIKAICNIILHIDCLLHCELI